MIKVAQIKLRRAEDEPTIEDVLNDLLAPDSIITVTVAPGTGFDHPERLVVLYRA